MTGLSEQHIATIKDTSRKLTGLKRRTFQGQVAINYLNSGMVQNTLILGNTGARSSSSCCEEKTKNIKESRCF